MSTVDDRPPTKPTLAAERSILLAVGFLSLTVALYTAWNHPASAYEVSIYTGTPVEFWGAVAGAFLAAVIVSVVDPRDRFAALAVLLGGFGAISIGGLPVIRGYRSYGLADTLTHLGWTEDIRAGTLGFFDLFYPASHSMTALFAELAGIPTERGLIVFMMLMVALYCLFIPLAAYAITDDLRITVIAAFSGYMLLPFTTISTALHFHTYSIGTMFLPLVAFVLIRYLTNGDDLLTLRHSATGWMACLFLVGAAMLFLHPQVKLNVIILLGAIAALQLRYRKRTDHLLGTLHPVYPIFAVFAVLWFVWMVNFSDYLQVGDRVIQAVIDTLAGTASPGETVTAQTTSASLIGAGVGELFVKLFLIPLLYCMLAVYAGARVIFGGFDLEDHHTSTVVAYFAWGGVILIPFFVLHYAGNMSHLFFRHVGFALVLATIFGAIGLSYLSTDLFGWIPRRRFKVVGVFVIAAVLVMTLLVAFPSPYIYSHSHHVTDQDMTGHATVFESNDPSIGFSGVRSWPHRYAAALTTDFPNPTYPALTGDEFTDPTAVRDDPFYLPVSTVDYDREVVAYQELRYAGTDFHRLDSTNSIDKVYTNGGFTLFLVTPRSDGSAVVDSTTNR